MSLRTRLMVFVLLFGSAVLTNIFALFYLVRSISTSIDAIERIRQRQLLVVQMNAHLRDAEAALYRYQINGELGFKLQFANQLDNFAQDLAQYRQFATDQQEFAWADVLQQQHRQAQSAGEDLITLHDRQAENLGAFLTLQAQFSDYLLLNLKPLQANSQAYQASLTDMQDATRAMLTAVTGYLASPDETQRVQFTDAVVNFRTAVNTAPDGSTASEVTARFDQMQSLGSQLISERDLQQSMLVNFFVIVFNAGQQTIVGKIEPHEASKFSQEQQTLLNAVNTAILLSIGITVLISVVAILFMFYLTRQVNQRVDALLQGAERVAGGDLDHPVQVIGSDEFSHLSASFNKMMHELANREERLRALVSKMAQIQDEERRLIGLDLHDGLTQLIISANMHLNTLNALIGSRLELEATQSLDVSRTLIRESIDEARRVISELRPTVVEDFGLEEGLRRYVADLCESQKWQYDMVMDIRGLEITPAVNAAIFRIAQEALANVRKHAHTQRVRVELKTQSGDLLLSVQDWGQGFDPALMQDESRHLGLVSMQERAQMIGGICSITSHPGQGTLVEVRIPLVSLVERGKDGEK